MLCSSFRLRIEDSNHYPHSKRNSSFVKDRADRKQLQSRMAGQKIFVRNNVNRIFMPSFRNGSQIQNLHFRKLHFNFECKRRKQFLQCKKITLRMIFFVRHFFLQRAFRGSAIAPLLAQRLRRPYNPCRAYTPKTNGRQAAPRMVRRLLAKRQGEFCKNSREKNYTDVIFFTYPCRACFKKGVIYFAKGKLKR